MTEQADTRLGTIIAFTIAVLTLFSGLLGWQMGNIRGNAEDEYSSAEQAELNRQKVISSNTLATYESHRAFLAYKNYFDQYKLIAQQLEEAKTAGAVDENLVTQLTSQRDEMQLLYLSSLKLFPNQFIGRDGTYNLQEQLGQMIASDARKYDLDPKPHKEQAQRYDVQAQNMQIALIMLAVSLFILAVTSTIQDLKPRVMLSMVVLGYLSALLGVVTGIINWS